MITVAMITMNEEKAVEKVIRDLRNVLNGLDAEILVVDSSRDRTPFIAESLGARVVRQFPPQGYGRAMARALTEARGDAVVTLDCDDTYPAEKIPELAQMVLSGQYDEVNASRLAVKPQSMPWSNYLANWLFTVVARILLGAKFTDLHSGMRAYSRTLLRHVEFDPSGPALPVELLLKPYLMGYRIHEVCIEYRDRIGDTTLQKWSSTWWTFKRIFRLFPLVFRKPAVKEGEAKWTA
jgi:glycosyltransferase involved in cell wall biosynthesis